MEAAQNRAVDGEQMGSVAYGKKGRRLGSLT